MNSKLNFIILLVLVGLVVFKITTNQDGNSLSTKIKGETAVVSQNDAKLQSQTRTMGAVEVEVTPTQLEPGKEAVFEIALNTHSVDLEYDYTDITSLRDDQGNTYGAVEWSGGSGGHHLSGVLSFEALSEDVQAVTVTITGIDDTTTQFEWEL